MKKRIAFLVPTFPIGGVERIIIDVGNYLVDQGLSVTVFCEHFDVDGYPANKERKFRVEELGKFLFSAQEPHPDQLMPVLKQLGTEVLCCHYVLENVLRIRQETGCKMVFTHHGMPFWEYQELFIQKRERKGLDCKFSNFIKMTLTNHFQRSTMRRLLAQYRQRYDTYDAFTCLCEKYRNELLRAIAPSDGGKKLYVLHNPEATVPVLTNETRQKVVLFVGRLTHTDKRVDRLLRIWQQIQSKAEDWELHICGDGFHRQTLEEQAQMLRLERVKFMGWQTNVGELMRRASILCLTSTYEGWPLCLTEAQANGLPAIAFNCSAGVEEILGSGGEYGVLVKPYDEKAYARQLLALIGDASRRQHIAQQALNHVSRYDIDHCGEEWMRMLQQV